MPGAKVELAGAYGLKAETIDFKGQLLLDAKISETVTGVKSVLLKVVDPLFKQEGRHRQRHPDQNWRHPERPAVRPRRQTRVQEGEPCPVRSPSLALVRSGPLLPDVSGTLLSQF